MEALFQIVGCLLSSEPADQLIDGFVTGVRRERAVVTTRNAHGATFVRFNAPDAKLVAMACAAVAGAGGQSLRFGFASGTKDRARTGHDAFSISSRYIAQANELAAAARPGEVLVTPKLALLLVESGFTFDARELRVASGRKLMACALDLPPAEQAASTHDEPEKKAGALGSVFQVLLAQAEEIARRQDELEARQPAALVQAAPVETGAASRPAGLEGDLEAQFARLETRWAALDRIEQRIDQLEQRIQSLAEQEVLVQAVKAEVENIRQISGRSKADLQFVSEHRNEVSELRTKVEDLLGRVHDTDGKIEMIESRRKMVEEVQARANGIIHMLQDINVNLEMLGEQRAVVDHVGEKLARLDFTVQEAHNTLRALQREREVAERIEQGIKALRTRSGTINDTAPVAS
jgi:prefoldin subunit 5